MTKMTKVSETRRAGLSTRHISIRRVTRYGLDGGPGGVVGCAVFEEKAGAVGTRTADA